MIGIISDSNNYKPSYLFLYMPDVNPDILYAKRTIELIKIAVNDLRHYGSDPIVVDNLQSVHDTFVREYNSTFFPEPKPEKKEPEQQPVTI